MLRSRLLRTRGVDDEFAPVVSASVSAFRSLLFEHDGVLGNGELQVSDKKAHGVAVHTTRRIGE
jgi:hypothetical protein